MTIRAALCRPSKKVYPQSVSGNFRRIKWGLMAFCLGVYYLLPFVRWNRGLGAPSQAVLIDLAQLAASISSSSSCGRRKSTISPGC